MNAEALHWLKERQNEAACRARRAFLLTSESAVIEWPAATAEHVMRMYGVNRHDEAVAHAHNPQHWIDGLESDLFDDLQSLTGADPLLERCALAFIPDVVGNAVAVRIKEQTYGIAVNLGIVWLCFLVAQAILMEADERQDDDRPREIFLSAVRAFRSTSARSFYQEIGYCSAAAELDVLVSAGGVGSAILRFVGLHEFAHIRLGHADVFGRSVAVADEAKTVYQSSSDVDLTTRQWDELEADRLATVTLIQASSSPETARNVILFVCAFFYTLQYIEEQQGDVICPEHPSPEHRARAIRNLCDALLGPPENDAFSWLDLVFARWKGNFMSELHLSVRTDTPDDILALFKGESEVIADGLKIVCRATTVERGMTLEEVVINFGLSLVSGVPAGMVANYLYQRFADGGNNVLRLEGKLVKSIDELQATLDELQRSRSD